jgi:hypothetical protein
VWFSEAENGCFIMQHNFFFLHVLYLMAGIWYKISGEDLMAIIKHAIFPLCRVEIEYHTAEQACAQRSSEFM